MLVARGYLQVLQNFNLALNFFLLDGLEYLNDKLLIVLCALAFKNLAILAAADFANHLKENQSLCEKVINFQFFYLVLLRPVISNRRPIRTRMRGMARRLTQT